RRQMRTSRSVTRSRGTASAIEARVSLIEGAPGEQEEHVLQRTAPDQDRVGVDAVRTELGRGLVALRRVHEDPVAEGLDALPDAGESGQHGLLLLVGGEAE